MTQQTCGTLLVAMAMLIGVGIIFMQNAPLGWLFVDKLMPAAAVVAILIAAVGIVLSIAGKR